MHKTYVDNDVSDTKDIQTYYVCMFLIVSHSPGWPWTY